MLRFELRIEINNDKYPPREPTGSPTLVKSVVMRQSWLVVTLATMDLLLPPPPIHASEI